MGKKDIKAKEFLADNNRFADLFNYYMFNGRQVILPGDLEERDTAEVLSIYGIDRKEIQKQRWRDLIKYAIIKSNEKAIFMLLGIENQSEIHYAMPIKNMIYDAMNYAVQVEKTGKKHKREKDYDSSAEFLSGFMREDRLTPVITLTVYWGADEWDAPRCLHDMLREEDKELFKYIDNYHIHLIVPQEITDFERFRTSVGEVLEIIKASDSEEKMKKAVETNPAFKSLENDAVSVINMFTGIDIPINREEGKTDMCKAWEDHWLSGKAEGKAEGIAEGKAEGIEAFILDNLEEGRKEEIILQKLIRRFNLEESVAREYFNKYSKAIV